MSPWLSREANPEGQIFLATTLNGLDYEYLGAGDVETAVAVFALERKRSTCLVWSERGL